MFRQASSAEWRTVVASALAEMGVACWEYDLSTGELWWSENGGPLIGRPRGFVPVSLEEAFGITLPDESKPSGMDAIVESLREGPIESDRQMLCPDGSPRWIRHRYYLSHDPAGEPSRLLGMMIDIDSQKRREREEAALLEASQVLGSSLDVGETLQSVAELLVPDAADWCVVHLLEEGRLEPVVTAHVDPEKVKWAHAIQDEYPVDMESPVGAPNVLRTGKSEFYAHIPDEMLVAVAKGDERVLEILRKVGYRSVVVVPLTARGGAIGTVTLVMAESQRGFDEQSLRFAERLGALIGAAISNARLHSALESAWAGQRHAVDTLQHGLTPDPLFDLPGVTIAAHYEIGGEAKVGGDWYDAFPTQHGGVGLVIGDVVGRGVPAVAAMSRYRHSERILLMADHGPGEVLTLCNRLVAAREPAADGFATSICMLYSPGADRLRWARAGHPPAMVLHPDGTVERLWRMSDPPFGVTLDHEYPEAEMRVEPGTVLVLCTDGLIERRGEDIETSLRRLEAELASAPRDPDELVAHLLDRLPSYPSSDDVAVLVARFDGAAGE